MPKLTESAGTQTEQFAILKPRVTTLKQATVRKRWRKLPIGTQGKIAELLRTAQRPAFTHGRSDRRNLEAQVAVSELLSKLIQRLPRMPFPPGTDDLCFDFETTINQQRVLEDQLTANTHTVGLLEAEVAQETRLLEQEKRELDNLEKGLAGYDGSDSNQRKRLHPFTQANGLGDALTRRADYETRHATKIPPSKLSELEHDAEARGVLGQLQYHLDRIESNVDATREIKAALTASEAALDVFNWRNLERAEYRQVYRIDTT